MKIEFKGPYENIRGMVEPPCDELYVGERGDGVFVIFSPGNGEKITVSVEKKGGAKETIVLSTPDGMRGRYEITPSPEEVGGTLTINSPQAEYAFLVLKGIRFHNKE